MTRLAAVTSTEFVLANLSPDARTGPGIWNFYPTLDAAKADQERANADCLFGPYEPMTHDAYNAGERAYYLDQSAEEITAERWMYFLEVLPPLKWETRDGYDSFLMSEFQSGPYTHQYVAFGKGETTRYFAKLVDAFDRSTWLTEVPS